MKKNIWIFHHYADPPDGRWTETYHLHKHLVKNGHRVTIFSSSFSHYTREEERLKTGEFYKEEYFNGVRFVFIKTPPYFNNDYNYALNMLLYSLRAYKRALYYKERPDVIIGATPHPFCALAAYLLSRRKKTRFFFQVFDLWPQFFVEIGLMAEINPIVIGLRCMEKFLFKKADKILTAWPRMDLYIQQFGIPPDKIVWLPLGIDEEEISFTVPRLGRPKFVAMYRGRFGLTQDMMPILQAAKILQDEGRLDISFVISGEGPERKRLVRYIKEQNLKNTQFKHFVPREQMRKDMVEADVFLGSLPDLPHFRKFGMISTKLIDYLSGNRPIILATNIKDCLVEKAGAGLVVPTNNPKALAKAIVTMTQMSPKERISIAESGVNYIKKNHNLRLLAKKLESLL